MDRVTAPVQVVTTRRAVLDMWEPYATLRYLNKPVDLIVLNSGEHVLTNPAVRLASQGGTVDFVVLDSGYRDPDPRKSEQYERWEHLRAISAAESHATG